MVDATSPFDRKLELIDKSPNPPPQINEAAAYVHDTMELAFLSASELLQSKPTAEAVLGFYDRIDAERRRRAGEMSPKSDGGAVVVVQPRKG